MRSWQASEFFVVAIVVWFGQFVIAGRVERERNTYTHLDKKNNQGIWRGI